MRLFVTVLLALLFIPSALAQPASCELGDASADLAFSDVRARLFNKGNLVFDGGSPLYEVPKGSGISPLFASGIWVGGTVGGEIRTAAATYAQGLEDYEFWPGPLSPTGEPPADCEPFDRIWTVNVREVELYEATEEATPDLAEWPVELGAPFTDANGDGAYDLAVGDRPVLFGHETAFWVMNDAGGFHASTLSEPIGLEVRVTAFTVASADPDLDLATFYRYELDYRGDAPFENAYFTFWADPDLGNFTDDYIGSDSTRGLGFVYNSDNDDEVGAGGYGLAPPALGVDLLTGAGHTMHYFSNTGALGNPDTDEDFYNFMQAQWRDGLPLTEGGEGYDPDGTPIDFLYPGDPTVPAYWSEICPTPDCGPSIEPDDRRFTISTPAFSLQPGETKVVDFAILFARGADHLDSVTELKATSDAVQARYDAGTLFAPFDPPASLPAPVLTSPENGTFFVEVGPLLEWQAVPGATGYTVETASESGNQAQFTTGTSVRASFASLPNAVTSVTWRVRAENDDGAVGRSSEVRTFDFYRYAFDDYMDGIGIVEVANPNAAVCPDAGDPGCPIYDGNTVWLDPNATDDYVVTAGDHLLNVLSGLLRNAETIDGDNLEMRFTAACATPGTCLGVYASPAPGNNNDLIASVPFELWNAGAENDAADDVRMIPILRSPPESDADPVDNWADTFSAERREVIVGEDTLELNVTHRVLWMMPDRDDGYARFADAAASLGGVGNTYDPEADGDVQIDINPRTGEPCLEQGYYIDFCYRGGSSRLTSLLGGTGGMQLADLAEDGTTPPAGTVIRFDANEREFDVGAEDDAPSQPTGFALGAAYPNPFRASTVVPFSVERPGRVRVSVFDVLGREVAVLEDREVAVGQHRAVLSGTDLASGVYLVVLDAGGRRQATKVLLMR